MGKIKIKLKIQGFELEVEGEREHLPEISHGLKQQVAGFIQAPTIVAGADPTQPQPRIETQPTGNGSEPGRGRKRSPRSNSGSSSTAVAIDFEHAPAKWGTPKQDWTTLQKAIWLLYVLAKQTDCKELSSGGIAATFNKHFRQAKEIHPANVHRDLGRAKVASPALVGEKTTQSPSVWYLTQSGEQEVQKLLSDATQGILIQP